MDIQKAMDRAFEGFTTSELLPSRKEIGTFDFNPNCEFTETPTQFKMKFDLPGMNKDQIKIDLHENILSVSGERREEKKEEDKKRHFTEISYGSFLRSFTLPTAVDSEKVEAKYDNGQLNVTLTKVEPTKARQIVIK